MTKRKKKTAVDYDKLASELGLTWACKELPTNIQTKTDWTCETDHPAFSATYLDLNRTKQCPVCDSLGVRRPDVSAEWHPIKNGSLTPFDLKAGSDRKVWWKCSTDAEHKWEAHVKNRTKDKGTGCPYCSTAGSGPKRASKSNNLQKLFPEIAKQWHPSKNGSLKPANVLPGSNRRVWWKCAKDAEHEWEAQVIARTKGTGCPYCVTDSGARKASKSNNLQKLFPEIAKQWHPSKNGSLKPANVLPGSNRRVWWQCSRESEHVWAATIYQRAKRGGSCPHCNKAGTSRFEIRIFTELLVLFPDAKWRWKINGLECDIYIPNQKIAVEADGYFWHKDKTVKDRRKTNQLKKIGVTLYRVREEKLPRIAVTDVFYKESQRKLPVIKELIAMIRGTVTGPKVRRKLASYLKNTKYANDREYRRLVSFLPGPPPEKSLASLYKEVAEDWHPTKNRPLRPELFSPGSHKKVWWKCSQVPSHEWQATILSKTSARNNPGAGCPLCAGKKVAKDNSLATKRPDIAKQWHRKLNGELSPSDVTASSDKRVWWQCPRKGHEPWEATVNNRTKKAGSNCPACWNKKRKQEGTRRATGDQNLAKLFPEIAKEWHPTKNKPLKPEDLRPFSHKRVWWKCKRGHVWAVAVYSRTGRGNGCQQCREHIGTRPGTATQNLANIFPKIAMEWHPSKNKPLKPEELRPFSGKRVWWKCKRGHVWATTVGNRTRRGHGCRRCRSINRKQC